MPVLLDTNILLRSAQTVHPMHETAVMALARLSRQDERLVVTVQNIAELWNVATRPTINNGLGFSIEEATAEILKVEHLFGLLYETEESYKIWKKLVLEYRVHGVKIHDTRLVSVMKANEVTHILTFNAGDFTRYPGIEAIHPGELA
jgi:predicted nucleic acid-binding protein